jgi:hypothetical protein
MTFEAMANVAGLPRGHLGKISFGDARQQIGLACVHGGDKRERNYLLHLESFFPE